MPKINPKYQVERCLKGVFTTRNPKNLIIWEPKLPINPEVVLEID